MHNYNYCLFPMLINALLVSNILVISSPVKMTYNKVQNNNTNIAINNNTKETNSDHNDNLKENFKKPLLKNDINETDGDYNHKTIKKINKPMKKHDTYETDGDLVNINIKAHLKNPTIQKICTANRSVCDTAVDNSELCTVRIVQGKQEERSFKNWCYLFLTNMCDNPGHEYYITFPNNCAKYNWYRRNHNPPNSSSMNNTRLENNTNSTVNTPNETVNNITGEFNESTTTTRIVNYHSVNDTTGVVNTTNEIVKNESLSETHDVNTTSTEESTASIVGEENPTEVTTTTQPAYPKKYEHDTAWDTHICPYSCTNDHKPVCFVVNNGLGMGMRTYTFANHCLMDMYQCANPRLFPDEDLLQYSDLGMTFCSSTGYTQFARFTESISTMSHFGWLGGGNFKHAHIVQPHERVPGFGKK